MGIDLVSSKPAVTPPRPALQPSKTLGNVDLETLFDEIISKTEEREAFSGPKERNIGFSALEDMKNFRSEFIDFETELELLHALVKLSNAQRDVHLDLRLVEGGLPRSERRSCVFAPIQVFPDYSDINNPVFSLAAVDEGVTSPKRGDVIVGANGQSIPEYINEFHPGYGIPPFTDFIGTWHGRCQKGFPPSRWACIPTA